MADQYTLDCCYGGWFFTTTQSNLNGQIDVEGTHVGNNQRGTAHFTLEDNGDYIVWHNNDGTWTHTLRKIGDKVWHAKGNHGSHPYLIIYNH
jgi:hypothetical protein